MDQFAVIANMVSEAEQHADNGEQDRIRATEYNRGVMRDTPSEDGRSAMTTRDVRDHIKKVLPSIVRTILGSDDIVEYQPVSEGDEDIAAQASQYVNRVVAPECNIRSVIMDAVHDALLLRNGIIKWWWEEKAEVSFSRYTGLDENALAMLAGDDEVSIVEHDERLVQIQQSPDQPPVVVPVHDVKIKRMTTAGKVRIASVPRENFLIHPDAVTLSDSLITGEKTVIRRSDLVAMGYDKAAVDALPTADDDETEEVIRRDFEDIGDGDEHGANQEIDYYDLYIRLDTDGDGIAELRHMVFAGGLKEANLLIDDECDHVQFCDVRVMSQPHQWEGLSLFDDLQDLQRVKTVLLRQTLDNLYWQNNPQIIRQAGAIENPDAVDNPEFGRSIIVGQGKDTRAAISFNQVPFVAQHSYTMMEYLDKEAQSRTGISDASSGLAPDALQNMTAKASAMIEQAGIGQTELMVREVAEGLRALFVGILKLITRHQDIPRTVRLRDKWVEFDPRQWNSGMDCVVNTGLGAGTRERDMMMMQMVMGVQEKLLAAFGAANNPYVTPENLWESVSKLTESAGLKTPGLYFTQPDPQQIQQRIEDQKNQPSPDQIQAQAEQQKLQMQMQLEQAKMQVNTAKEKAQMDADLQVKQAEIAAERQKQADELQSRAMLAQQQMDWEREKFYAQLEADRMAESQKRQDEIDRFNAEKIAAELRGVAAE